jgi:DNA-binding MarR family transcriptional regulator
LWALDATEGIPGRPARRQWRTTLRSVTMAEAQSDERTFEAGEERRARRAEAIFERHRKKVLDFFAQNPQGGNARYVRDKLGLSGTYVVRALEALVREGILATSELKKLKRTEIIYTLAATSGPESPAGAAVITVFDLTKIGTGH